MPLKSLLLLSVATILLAPSPATAAEAPSAKAAVGAWGGLYQWQIEDSEAR